MKSITIATALQKNENDFMNFRIARRRILNDWMTVFLTCAFIALVGPLWSQNILTPEMVAKIENVSQVALSENGEYTSFVLSTPADPFKENKGAESHLYLYKENAGVPFYTRGSVSSIAYRPGHSTLTFLSRHPELSKNVLYQIALDGGEASVLYEFDRSISGYSWHPNGKSLLFRSTDEAEKSESKMPYSAKVYEENQPMTSGYTVVPGSDRDAERIPVEGSMNMAEWSQDGSKIAVAVSPTSGIDDFYMFQKISIVNANTGDVTAEINNAGKLGQIEWSPDGRQIAIRAAADINDPTDGRILLVSVNGGNPRLIDSSFEGKYEQIRWSKNDEIQFLASEGTSSIIGTLNPSNNQKKIIFRGTDFDIRSVAFSGVQRSAFVASTPSHPYELFEMSSSGQANRLTHHNPWLDDVKLGKQEVITYKSRDGKYDIEGILIHPVEGSSGSPAPTITVVHGGPESHYLNGWMTSYSSPGQMAAGNGYAVFYPNYRGSTGRGIDFAYSSQGDLGGAEFDDVVDGVDHLIAQGIADKDRIGVTGGSYGGYATAWMSTYYSDRFAAGVMFVGISNNLSKWGTSDIPEELYLVHARKRIWEDWDGYLKRSPVYYVDRSKTPLLIMHGEQDTRVYPGQSLELYRHLKVRKPDVPVRLVWYPGEGHGNRNATARYDYSVRMMRWFDTYLKTGNAKAELPSWQAPVKGE